MKSLIVGMGIGQLYKAVLTQLNYTVITVDSDPSKGADFTKLYEAMAQHGYFDTAHICTPNFTHLDLATRVAPYTKIVFIEKPGVENAEEWQSLLDDFPETKFLMVKNNMWRNNISEMRDTATKAKKIHIDWIRHNCIPSPGSWFTNKKLAWGGVSRDLMPHLLSLYVALNNQWRDSALIDSASLQKWKLHQIDSTDYGTVLPNGTYDVDDNCMINFNNRWFLEANWRSMAEECSAITLTLQDGTERVFELGWCPEDAYRSMITDAVNNLNNEKFWREQNEIDLWIHERLTNL